MKKLSTITRNKKLTRTYINFLIVDKKKPEQALKLICDSYKLKSDTVLRILNSKYYKKTYSKVRNCPVKIKKK